MNALVIPLPTFGRRLPPLVRQVPHYTAVTTVGYFLSGRGSPDQWDAEALAVVLALAERVESAD